MSSQKHKVPEQGVYVPAITFFHPEKDSLVPSLQSAYYAYLSRTGLTGLVVLGTNAETLLLTREERATLLRLARKAVPEGYPIIAGVSGHSTAQVKEYITDAVEAGADYVLVLPCAYFGKQTTPTVIKSFFDEIATFSPLPVIVYNFPAVCNGIDLDSDTIAALAQKSSNIVGVKLTCGSVGKITRLAAQFGPERFVVFGGQSDFLVGGLAAGSGGCIAAFGNIFPKTIVEVYNLYKKGQFAESLGLQQKAALAEAPTKAGIATTKYAASLYTCEAAGMKQILAQENLPGNIEDYARPRRPYEEPAAAVKSKIAEVMTEVAGIEQNLKPSSSTSK